MLFRRASMLLIFSWNLRSSAAPSCLRKSIRHSTALLIACFVTFHSSSSRISISVFVVSQKNYTKKIAVEVEAVNNYIDAEEYHRKYLEKNPTGYCHVDLSLAKKSL